MHNRGGALHLLELGGRVAEEVHMAREAHHAQHHRHALEKRRALKCLRHDNDIQVGVAARLATRPRAEQNHPLGLHTRHKRRQRALHKLLDERVVNHGVPQRCSK
jgi:hypothetical protein